MKMRVGHRQAEGSAATTSLAAKVTAAGFLVGSSAHAVGLLLMGFGIELYGAGYPPWRHVVFVVVDAVVAWISARRPSVRVFPLAAFCVDQIVEHGVRPVGVLVFVSVVAAVAERWPRRRSSLRQS
jgi:hypothetical protein